jgi:hypothetical protein
MVIINAVAGISFVLRSIKQVSGPRYEVSMPPSITATITRLLLAFLLLIRMLYRGHGLP